MEFPECADYIAVKLESCGQDESWKELDETVGNAFFVVVIDSERRGNAVVKVDDGVNSKIGSLEIRISPIRRNGVTHTRCDARRKISGIMIVRGCEDIQAPYQAPGESADRLEGALGQYRVHMDALKLQFHVVSDIENHVTVIQAGYFTKYAGTGDHFIAL